MLRVLPPLPTHPTTHPPTLRFRQALVPPLIDCQGAKRGSPAMSTPLLRAHLPRRAGTGSACPTIYFEGSKAGPSCTDILLPCPPAEKSRYWKRLSQGSLRCSYADITRCRGRVPSSISGYSIWEQGGTEWVGGRVGGRGGMEAFSCGLNARHPPLRPAVGHRAELLQAARCDTLGDTHPTPPHHVPHTPNHQVPSSPAIQSILYSEPHTRTAPPQGPSRTLDSPAGRI